MADFGKETGKCSWLQDFRTEVALRHQIALKAPNST